MKHNFKPLEDILGDRITTDELECQLYGTDLAPLPKIINLLFKTVPDAVVRPGNTKEISEIMMFANKNKIYVTPRASATSALGNAVPTRGGIVMDMSSLDNEIEINEEEKTALLSPGVVWHKLEKVLNRKNLTTITYPSSAPSATVGGWLSSPGYGIGSIKYGSVYSQVLGMEVVLPNGTIRQLSGKEKYNFLGTEGTTGIITGVKLKVRDIPEKMSHHLLKFNTPENFCSTIQKLVKINPFNISYADKTYIEMIKNAVEDKQNSINPDFKFKSLIIFDGSEKEVCESIKNLNKIKNSDNIKEQSPELAKKEWEERFKPMRIKRRGPTLLAGDLLVPLKNLNTVIKKLNELNISKLGIEGTVVAENKVVVMPMYLTDERKFLDFIFSLRHLKKMNDIAISAGGIPYGTGLWNSPYLNKILEREEFNKKVAFKRKFDKNNILNPDKHLGSGLAVPSLIFNPKVYGLSMLAAEVVSKPLSFMGIIR